MFERAEQVARFAVGQQRGAERRAIEQIDLLVLVAPLAHREQDRAILGLRDEMPGAGLVEESDLLARPPGV